MQTERPNRAQERDLVIAAEAGDRDARRKLVEAFLPSIGALARRFSAGRVDRQDLIQEGVAAMLFAAGRYDASLDTPFWAYASFWVRKAMQELVADLAGPVALSDRAVRDLAQVKAARAAHLQRHGAEPSSAELSSATGFTRVQLDHLLSTELVPRGMEEPLTAAGESSASFGDSISDPDAEVAFDQVLDSIEVSEISDLAAELGDREREVISAHYGLGRPAQTLGEIGSSLGITAERARQIEAHALRSLRDALASPVPTAYSSQ